MPVAAATAGGCVSVSSGSSIAARAAALGSPQAIFTCVCGCVIRANDWHSLPVPAVVGMAISGSIGRVGLADAPIVLHPPAVGQQEIAALGRIHAAAAAQADEEVDLLLPRDRDARVDHFGRGVLDDAIEACHADTCGGQRLFRAAAT